MTLPKTIPTQGQNIIRYFDWLPSNNQWQSFVCGSYLLDIRSISILTSLMISFWNSSNAFNFQTTKNYPNLTRGSKYRVIFWPPHLIISGKVFICLSYLLEKMYYYIKIIFMISWVFMMLLFCTTNTWFHKVINDFICCKLKQDSSHHLILFW